jgi:hypothetical protein
MGLRGIVAVMLDRPPPRLYAPGGGTLSAEISNYRAPAHARPRGDHPAADHPAIRSKAAGGVKSRLAKISYFMHTHCWLEPPGSGKICSFETFADCLRLWIGSDGARHVVVVVDISGPLFLLAFDGICEPTVRR